MEAVQLIKKILSSSVSGEEFSWLEKSVVSAGENQRLLQIAFVTVPRNISGSVIRPDAKTIEHFLQLTGLSPEGWTIHQLARLFILLHIDPKNEQEYIRSINTLFETAEMNELSALLGALPFLHYPENWISRAKEGVRTNMGNVFDAIAFNNPYPSRYFDEDSWNQMVLKTIFGGKNIQRIYGIKQRTNRELAFMISDFAHERWAAGRPIAPEVWELVAPFMDDRILNDMEKLFLSENKLEQSAARSACTHSDYEPAKELLKKYDHA